MGCLLQHCGLLFAYIGSFGSISFQLGGHQFFFPFVHPLHRAQCPSLHQILPYIQTVNVTDAFLQFIFHFFAVFTKSIFQFQFRTPQQVHVVTFDLAFDRNAIHVILGGGFHDVFQHGSFLHFFQIRS